ncbi:hypothetical protein GCM10010112_67010 [Actinoplanes lobatus]|uniref:Uncharacterized protein YukE n=1 Tax=Actinoplanes lobatus TaxID=113568 RepID=A0A7W7HI53_9ACTN|nr:WXG100 family type VII secretion target [Actinoplanes lobatus]MBB4750971.1 uncharacterized protein YukE [Actinoplanes lobatus]GGN85979.1 hypothetical protein GCM10010112_67010 [Actinoplanes lobatus]GIE43544.1 hypothetical protein Alo02nite_64420 [Actinoplanes lobatus]
MRFDVDLAAMESLRKLLERGSEDASSMRSYWEGNAGIDFLGEGVINLIQRSDDHVESSIGSYLDTLAGRTMPGLAEAIDMAARHYRATDQAAAASIDSALPGANVTAAADGDVPIAFDYYRPAPSFSDAADPGARLAGLPNFNQRMPYQPSWTDLSSPTSLLRDAIWSVTWLGMKLGVCDRQYDIAEVVLKPVLGDWAGMKATGVTMVNLSNAIVDLHSNLGRAILGIRGSWEGNAADAAVANLHEVRKSLLRTATALLKIGKEYDDAAEGCYDMSGTIGNILSDITDAAVAAAAGAAATGALTASGAGVPIALLLGAFTVTKVYRVCKEVYTMIKIIADMVSRVNAAVSAVDASAGDFGILDVSDFGSAPLPPGPHTAPLTPPPPTPPPLTPPLLTSAPADLGPR